MPLLLLLKELLLKRPWIIALVALTTVAGVQSYRLRSAQLDLARAKASNAGMAAAVKEQNSAIADWMTAAVAQHDRAEAAEKAAARIRVVTVTRVERVLAEPVPSDCPSAVSWGAEFGARFGTGWEEAAP
jgi:hypothetical protein